MRPGSLLATSEKTDPNSLPSLGVLYVLFSAFPTEQSLSTRAGADKLPIVATLVDNTTIANNTHIIYIFIRLFLFEDKYENNTLLETNKESVSQQAIVIPVNSG
jgi:hypothetical protein